MHASGSARFCHLRSDIQCDESIEVIAMPGSLCENFTIESTSSVIAIMM